MKNWIESFLLKVRLSKIHVCPAAHRFIADPKLAGSKQKYITGVCSFLKGQGLNEELLKFQKLTCKVELVEKVAEEVTEEVAEEVAEVKPMPRKRKKNK